jgi:hypothetical protein
MLKRIAAIVAIAIFSSATFAQESKPLSITIPQGTEIAARLANPLDSGQVHAGDLVTLEVLEDLKIENAIVIPHGSVVMGHVTEAKGARKMGRGGKLDISFQTVTAGDGTKVPVSGERFAKGSGGYGGGSVAGAAAAGLFFPPAGALLLLKHGHASVIPAGAILAVHVTADTRVAGMRPIPEIVAVSAAPGIHANARSSSDTPLTVVFADGSQSELVAGTLPSNSGVATPAQPVSLGEYARRLKAEKTAQEQAPKQ